MALRGALFPLAAAFAAAAPPAVAPLLSYSRIPSPPPSGGVFDVVVVGATPAGVSAAIAAADGGRLTVALVESLLYVGGMGAPGGLGLNDQQLRNLTSITGLARTWCNTNGIYYTPGNTSHCVQHPDNYVAEASYRAMLAAASVTVATGCAVIQANRSASSPLQIESVTADCSAAGGSGAVLFSAPRGVVVDATYDGDVMVLAGGFDYTWGREPNTTYGEPMAGGFWLQEDEETFSGLPNISAVDAQGNLLPGIEAGTPPVPGSGDDRLMAFQHRACVTTDANNSVGFPKPSGYDRSRYALLQSVLDGLRANGQFPDGPPASYFGLSGEYAPAVAAAGRHKTIVCCGAAAVMTDEPGLNRGWANATREQRAAMWQAHADYLMGFFYYLANDPAVPTGTRASFSSYGLCADEWADATPPNWPPQLYVRVSNRLVGDYVLTQNNMVSPRFKPNASVSCAIWELDAHITSRWGVPNPNPGPGKPSLVPFNEGFIRHSSNTSVPPGTACGATDGMCSPSDLQFDVPFAVMLPKRSQGSNLLVPVAISASNVAYMAARIETMFSDLGTAAGVAAQMVVDAGGPSQRAVQDVDVAAVQQNLVAVYGQRISCPFWS
jgi:hypothetical protein